MRFLRYLVLWLVLTAVLIGYSLWKHREDIAVILGGNAAEAIRMIQTVGLNVLLFFIMLYGIALMLRAVFR